MNYRKTFNRIILIAWSTIAAIFLLFSITLNNAQAKFLFETRIDYATDDGSMSLAIGDLNGDGHLDLAVANSGSDNVSVLLGIGDGSFQSAVNYAAGSSPNTVASGDLNGDSARDLVVTNNQNVSVLLGNGDGSFQSAVNYNAGDEPSYVAIGDLNGDGHLDLAVADSGSDNVSVLLGIGDGSFQSVVNYYAGNETSSVAIDDLNGDGHLDLAMTGGSRFSTNKVSILLGNGDGSFQDAVGYGAGNEPRSVAIGDLNGDGHLDLAVANYGPPCDPFLDTCSNYVPVLLGNGDGTFQDAVNYESGFDEDHSVTIGDLNGDGDLDLAVAKQSHVSILMGNGDGSFQSAVGYSTGSSPHSVATGDLNGDGDLDLALANWGSDTVSVLLGYGDGTFQDAVNYDPSGSSVAIGDLNGNGHMDLAVGYCESSGAGSCIEAFVSVLLGNGDGTFQDAVNYDYDSEGGFPSSIAIGDLNGDGAEDLAVLGKCGFSVLLGNGDGSFQSAVGYRPPGCYFMIAVAVGDLDGDGDLDLTSASASPIAGDDQFVWVFLGNGDGTFQDAVNYDAAGKSVAIGDLDVDGDLDIVGCGGSNVSVLLGNGNGTFQDALNNWVIDGAYSIAIGDLNGDDVPDLAVGNENEWHGDVSVLLGNGNGTFQDAVNYGAGRYVAIGDLNGDGDLDLAVSWFGSVSVQLGKGDGSFQSAVYYGARGGSIAIGDLNGDGKLDLVRDGVSILINTGPPTTVSLLYSPVKPCRIVDTRKAGGIIGASTQRYFHVFGNSGTIGAQGGNSAGCSSPMGEPLAAYINMVAVNPNGKGNLQAFPMGAGKGAGLSVNYNAIDTNLANAGTVKTVVGSGPDITVASNFSSAHTVIDVLGYYYADEGFYYTSVDPCRVADTRKTSAGIIGASTQREFRISGSVGDQGGNPAGCPSTLGVSPEAAHLNMIAVDPTGKGNLQAFPVGAGTGAGLSVNFNAIDTNLANAGTVKTSPDITVASNFSSAHTVIDVLGYYSEEEDLLYTPVTPCRIVDTRKTSAGIIGANTERNFRVFGSSGTISAQGGDSAGCSSPQGEPLAAHINMIAVNPTGKGNLQAFPVGAGVGAGLSVNYNNIDTNLANAGTVKTDTGSGPDISVASNFSSAHTVIDVLGYYYQAP